ncbi:MAG: hypothetical protein EOO15_13685 [Chitinophagaceae bacterium]|nr:MAG: hypothetical protein EOO15_13685 [Chitinophagaceae bacterium]
MNRTTALLLSLLPMAAGAQTTPTINPRWFSIGLRSTWSSFSHDGSGTGAGGQFRVDLSNRVSTDWFADYIVTHPGAGQKSTFYHIGWSVLYYPIDPVRRPTKLQPYLLAGHCFDYNEKNIRGLSRGRWGSAVQAGVGTHIHLSRRVSFSILSQYMLHLTRELEVVEENGSTAIKPKEGHALEGHMLSTVGLHVRLFQLGAKRSPANGAFVEEAAPVQPGLLASMLTLSPGWSTNSSDARFYLHAGLQYYFHPKWSVGSDVYLGMGTIGHDQAEKAPHNLLIGAYRHFGSGRSDASIGFAPGITLTKGIEVNGTKDNSSISGAPALSVAAGYQYFVNKHLQFFVQGRYLYSPQRRAPALSEVRASAGLGFHLQTRRAG